MPQTFNLNTGDSHIKKETRKKKSGGDPHFERHVTSLLVCTLRKKRQTRRGSLYKKGLNKQRERERENRIRSISTYFAIEWCELLSFEFSPSGLSLQGIVSFFLFFLFCTSLLCHCEGFLAVRNTELNVCLQHHPVMGCFPWRFYQSLREVQVKLNPSEATHS